MTKKSLIIVESPAKIKTLKKFLGSNYVLESSIGHIRDLPAKEFGIDVENDFEPTYVIMPDKKQVIEKLKSAAKKCDTVILSPDPDREGEAIAWHITQILPPGTNYQRVSFNAITKEAVLKALAQPRALDIALVNAQQARRLLDRIVGYKISPILNRRIKRGKDEGFVSAGRVQSVALKLVVDREKEIIAFKPVEYWNLAAILKTESEERSFQASLYSVDGKKVEKELIEGKDVMLINNQEVAERIVERLRHEKYKVIDVEKKEKKRNPVPPFITSTLQQEASRHHGFSSNKTMSIAQSLYEGVDLGSEGPEGLITYMRTDSVRSSPEAVAEVRDYIQQIYGKDYLPAQPKAYSMQKSAQDAHEAIRPTSMRYPPDAIEKYLTKEQFSLYQLIWRRFVSSQMTPAIYDTVSADIAAGKDIVLRATGSVMKFPGFLAAYEEKFDDNEGEDDSKMLPLLEANQLLKMLDILSEQAFTRPPPRYTEASLVKELEKSGIGRPSTYATIMNKIQSRDYTVKESGRLKPTELGCIIAQMLETSFQQIMNIGFTASMEDSLELVAENKKDWKTLLSDFWKDFSPTVDIAEKEAFVPKQMTDLLCPKCGSNLQKIWSKSKYFYGCSNYPNCSYTAPLEELSFNKEDYAEDFDWEQHCPLCQSEMKIRHGKFGAFLGCTTYPNCKGIVNIPKKGEITLSTEDMPTCPAIGCDGHLNARKSRFGKTFYSCSNYPDCDVIVNSIDQLASKYVDHPKTPYVKKTKDRKGKKTGITTKAKQPKEKKSTRSTKAKTKEANSNQLSPELAFIVGGETLSRPMVMKKLWEYIKTHNLQNPQNKREIVPDAALAKVFGSKEPLDMFKMTAVVNKHIH